MTTAQTSLEGKVIEAATGEPVLFGAVVLYKNDVRVGGTTTDIDGNYSFSNIDAGTYDVEASYLGLQTLRISDVTVSANKANIVNIDLEEGGVIIDEVVVREFKAPLIDKDNTTSGAIKTADQIKNLPVKDINSLAATTAGLSTVDGGNVSIRGSRTNQTNYYVDGVRVSGRMIQQSEIEQLQVLTGGIGAKYGDVTGGIISITTKGPSKKFSGGIEAETSEFLDPYGYNLFSANLSGPILKNEEGNSVLGFRIAGQYLLRKEDDPPAYGVYRATESKIKELENDPVFTIGQSTVATGERVSEGDGVEFLDARPNEEQTDLDLTAKLDARLSENIDITLSGSLNKATDRFSPGAYNTSNQLNEFQGTGDWDTYNWINNPMEIRDIYRGNFRFRHRLGSRSVDTDLTDEEKASKSSSLIQNTAYIIQAGYEKRLNFEEDWRHGDNFFNYGYVGSFDTRWDTIFQTVIGPAGPRRMHVGYNAALYGYDPSDINPALANYNKGFAELNSDILEYWAYNGTLSDVTNTVWRGNHVNVGGRIQ